MIKLQKAFTLLEVLVVIGIIAVLLGLGAVSFSSAQKKARDAKRKADVQVMAKAFEQYYSICGFKYPASGTYTAGTSLTATTGTCTALATDVTMLTFPTDPLGGSYQCPAGSTCDATAYTICPKTQTNGDYLETENCDSGNKTCCATNQQ